MRQPEQPRKPRSLQPDRRGLAEVGEGIEHTDGHTDPNQREDEAVDAVVVGDADEKPSLWERVISPFRSDDNPSEDQTNADATDDADDDEVVYADEPRGPIELSERRKEKKREERKVRLKKFGIGAGLIALILLVVWVLFESPIFQYRYDDADLTIEEPDGVVNLDNARNALAGHDGVQLLSLNTNALAADLIEEVPEIRAVTIERDLPSSLIVAVYPHEPVACLGTADNCQPVAANGTELRLGKTVKSRLPIVSVGSNEDVEAAVSIALDVLGAIDEDTRASVRGVKVTDAGLVTLTLTEGRTVFWGPSQENEFKAQVLAPLIDEDATKIDISVPRSPVTS